MLRDRGLTYETVPAGTGRGRPPRTAGVWRAVVLAGLAVALGGCARRAEMTYRRAEVFFAQGEYRLAALEYEKVVASFPQSELADDALYKLGHIHRVHLEEPREALQAYLRLPCEYPTSPYAVEALLALGWGEFQEFGALVVEDAGAVGGEVEAWGVGGVVARGAGIGL